jgi:SlyX protein
LWRRNQLQIRVELDRQFATGVHAPGSRCQGKTERPGVGEYNSTMEERVMELESRVAFQDQTIRDLNEVVRLFSDRVERLERRVSELAGGLRAGREEVGPHDEQPPHY